MADLRISIHSFEIQEDLPRHGRGHGSGGGGRAHGSSGSAFDQSRFQPTLCKTYEETMLLAEDAREATAEEAEETEAAAPEVMEEAAMEALEALGVPEAAETEAPPLVTPAAPAAEVAEAFKQSVEEPSWIVTGEE